MALDYLAVYREPDGTASRRGCGSSSERGCADRSVGRVSASSGVLAQLERLGLAAAVSGISAQTPAKPTAAIAASPKNATLAAEWSLR